MSASQALAQRQWRQRAQSTVRVALTATKEACSRFQAASDGGDAPMQQLANALLQLALLPGLRLGALGAMRPDVRRAAAVKLARQQQALAEGLQERVAELQRCVESLAAALASLDNVPQDEQWQRGGPIFHTMPLIRVRQLLAKVYDMYRLECDSKAAAVRAVHELLPPLPAAPLPLPQAPGTTTGSALGAPMGGGWEEEQGRELLSAASKGPGHERLSALCTAYVSVWMLGPYLEEEVAEEALGALTEDMAGF